MDFITFFFTTYNMNKMQFLQHNAFFLKTPYLNLITCNRNMVVAPDTVFRYHMYKSAFKNSEIRNFYVFVK